MHRVVYLTTDAMPSTCYGSITSNSLDLIGRFAVD
jgi:hypothetical protein